MGDNAAKRVIRIVQIQHCLLAVMILNSSFKESPITSSKMDSTEEASFNFLKRSGVKFNTIMGVLGMKNSIELSNF